MGKRKPESQLTLADLEDEENENQGEENVFIQLY